jgi:filamentous hemagglutinin family protein
MTKTNEIFDRIAEYTKDPAGAVYMEQLRGNELLQELVKSISEIKLVQGDPGKDATPVTPEEVATALLSDADFIDSVRAEDGKSVDVKDVESMVSKAVGIATSSAITMEHISKFLDEKRVVTSDEMVKFAQRLPKGGGASNFNQLKDVTAFTAAKANGVVAVNSTGTGLTILPAQGIIVKKVAQANTTTIFASDSVLRFPCLPSQTYVFKFDCLLTNANSAVPDLKMAILGPAGSTGRATMYGTEPGGVDFPQVTSINMVGGALLNAVIAADVNIPFNASVQGVITTTAAGFVTLQFAQNTASPGTPLTMQPGSMLTYSN